MNSLKLPIYPNKLLENLDDDNLLDNVILKTNAKNKYIYADFTITISNNEPQLQLNKSNVKSIKVSKYYSDLLLETTDLKTKEFLKQKIEKAHWFKESIEKREKTLKDIMLTIIQLQKEYLISGYENDLKPLKLADVANIVNMDISTISRVMLNSFNFFLKFDNDLLSHHFCAC